MRQHIFLQIFIGIFSLGIFNAGCNAATDCPSPPITYAAEGDDITLCWKMLPEAVNESDSFLKRITVFALKRPAELDMEKIASANKTGQFLRVYDASHNGLYKDKATVFADLPTGMFYLNITDYNDNMDNVYCPLYEMSGINDIPSCHTQALLLRNVALKPAENSVTVEGRLSTSVKNTPSGLIVSCLLAIAAIITAVL